MQDTAVVVPRPIADGCVNIGFDIVGSPPLSKGSTRTAELCFGEPGLFSRHGDSAVVRTSLRSPRHPLVAPRLSHQQRMARLYFPSQDPLGEQISFGFAYDAGDAHEIVGIVG